MAEIIASLFGFMTVWYSLKQNTLTWPAGIISAAVYIVVFYGSKLYADMGLQVIYIVVQCYGWQQWQQGTKGHSLPISQLTLMLARRLLLISVVGSISLRWFLHHYTDAQLALADATLTVLSLVSQYLLARKIIQTWHLWFIIDTGYALLYIYKQLYLTSILSLAYTGLAVMGYIWWRQSLRRQRQLLLA